MRDFEKRVVSAARHICFAFGHDPEEIKTNGDVTWPLQNEIAAILRLHFSEQNEPDDA